jgi:MOSC domain-containing protein YiiM
MKAESILTNIFVGSPKVLYGPKNEGGAEWTSSIFKDPVLHPVYLSVQGLEGNIQADLKIHGGSHKAILAYGAECYSFWKEIYGEKFQAGAFGENFTLSFWNETNVCVK